MGKVARREIRQRDGRAVLFYGASSRAPAGYEAPDRAPGIYESRWNPLRGEWVLVAASRQNRTFLPQRSDCPLCPSSANWSSEIPASSFDLAVFENRFPAMPPGGGSCEVVVYTEAHDSSFGSLSAKLLDELVDVWVDRYGELGSRPEIKYVYIFENRGEAVGVTLHHPHGQIYGYPFIPPVAATELAASRKHLRKAKRCLQCDVAESEVEAKERILVDDGGIIAYVPSFARYPFEVHVAPRLHAGALPDLSRNSRSALGSALQRVARGYDRLFGSPMPYMMVIHQRPTDGQPHPEAHLRAEFYPLLRMPGRLKYLAGGECGAGTFVSDGFPEAKAAELRAVI